MPTAQVCQDRCDRRPDARPTRDDAPIEAVDTTPAVYEELRQRLLQRESLIGAITRERNRFDALRRRLTAIASVRERLEHWRA